MPPSPPSSSSPRLALTRSQPGLDLPSLISDLTSLLLHSPAASFGAAAPVFSSSSLSIPNPTPAAPTPTATATTPTPLARAAFGACAGAAAGAFTYAALLPVPALLSLPTRRPLLSFFPPAAEARSSPGPAEGTSPGHAAAPPWLTASSPVLAVEHPRPGAQLPKPASPLWLRAPWKFADNGGRGCAAAAAAR